MIRPSRDTLAYIAGPYRDPRGAFHITTNIEAARILAGRLWQYGCTPVVPHLNTAHFDGLVDDQDFLDGAIAILSRCDLMVLLPPWQLSAGTRAEIRTARQMAMPIYAWDDFKQPMPQCHFDELIPPEDP